MLFQEKTAEFQRKSSGFSGSNRQKREAASGEKPRKAANIIAAQVSLNPKSVLGLAAGSGVSSPASAANAGAGNKVRRRRLSAKASRSMQNIDSHLVILCKFLSF